MQNLRDKLLKAGLVSEEQAKKVETPAPKAPRPASEQPASASGTPRGERDERPPRENRGRDERPPRRDGPGGGGGGGRPQGGGRPPQGSFRPQGARPPPGARPPQGARPPPGARPPAEAARPVPKLPPLPGSKAAQRMESKKQVEQDKKLRELVLTGQVPVDVGASVFYFMTRKGKLRRLELTEVQAKQLEEGVLGVVERPEPAQIEHSLVPASVAEQMFALSQKSVRFLNRKDSPIGFMSDDQVKEQQASEARGDAPVPDEDDESSAAPESGEAASAAPESPGEAPGEASGEGSSEPTPS